MVRISTIFDSELNQRMFLIMGDLVRIVATSIELDANKYTGKYKESVTLTATVTDKDSNPVGGVTVSFYNMNSRIGASVTNSNGVATFNYELTHDLSVNACVDDLTSNTVGIELIHDYNMDVVLDKSIIQTGETATFTTTLTDNNIPLSGENITYTYNGITEYVTTLDGEAKLPYTGTGVGDVEFVIKYGTLLQKTFVVQDCHLYDDATTDKSSNYSPSKLNGGVTGALTHDNINQAYNIKINEGKSATSTNAGYFLVNLPVTSNNCLFSAKIKGSALENDFSTPDFGLAKWNTSNNLAGMHYIRGDALTKRYSESNSGGNTHKINQNSNPTITRDTWYIFSLEINGTIMIFKLYDGTGETELYTHTATCSTSILDGNLSIVCGWGKQQLFVKDIKVKAL